jgi:hypothetical protein
VTCPSKFNEPDMITIEARKHTAEASPMRSTESVGICLIFTHDLFGRSRMANSRVNGKPARRGWLASATAMTVLEQMVFGKRVGCGAGYLLRGRPMFATLKK